MHFHGPDHVYECIPPFRNNRNLPPEEQIVIGLKGFSMPEIEAHRAEISDIRQKAISESQAAERIEAKNREAIASRVIFIRGLTIEGVGEIADFKTLYRYAPVPLVEWVLSAPLSTEELIRSDRKTIEGPRPA